MMKHAGHAADMCAQTPDDPYEILSLARRLAKRNGVTGLILARSYASRCAKAGDHAGEQRWSAVADRVAELSAYASAGGPVRSAH